MGRVEVVTLGEPLDGHPRPDPRESLGHLPVEFGVAPTAEREPDRSFEAPQVRFDREIGTD
jgi:hypothetical protein